MNEIMMYAFNESNVRAVVVNNEAYFVGKDVALILDYSNPKDAIRRHVDDEDKTDGVVIYDSIGRPQRPVLINESGLYSLILRSKKPEAKEFKRWITKEVLPSIRKTGSYSLMENVTLDSYMIEDPAERAKRWAEEYEEKKLLIEFKEKNESVVTYANEVLNDESLLTTTEIAKDYGWSAQKLNKYLKDKKIIFKKSKDYNRPYSLYDEYAEMGLAKTTTYGIKYSNRKLGFAMTLRWTQEGRRFIHNLLREDGIHPVCNLMVAQAGGSTQLQNASV